MHTIPFPIDTSDYAAKILDSRDLWIYRDPFYTIGASAYLDEPQEYYILAPITNQMLESCIGDLYSPLQGALEEFLSCPVSILPGAAMPGVHIFNSKCNDTEASLHIDQPYQRVFWSEPFSNPFTFTLVLQLPECGGGIEMEDETLEYGTNNLYIHSGLQPHRITNNGEIKEDEYRITLQGHGATLQFSKQVAIYF